MADHFEIMPPIWRVSRIDFGNGSDAIKMRFVNFGSITSGKSVHISNFDEVSSPSNFAAAHVKGAVEVRVTRSVVNEKGGTGAAAAKGAYFMVAENTGNWPMCNTCPSEFFSEGEKKRHECKFSGIDIGSDNHNSDYRKPKKKWERRWRMTDSGRSR
jgi:hypothetical protein